MREDLLLAVLAEWLEETRIPDLVPRQHAGVDLDALQRILAIVGPRRAGKTYFMYQLISDLLGAGGYSRRDILFIDFEDYRLSGFAAEDIDALFAAFHNLAGRLPRFLFFDEVQRLPNWSRVLRTLHNRRRFRIVVSGSNADLLYREVATELRGRYEHLLMLPFSFAEYLRQREISLTPATLHTAARGTVAAAFDAYLRHGGFPEVILAPGDSERRKILQNYFRIIFYKDVLERYGIKARHVLDALMSDLLETYSERFSVSRFEKQLRGHGLPGSKRTISSYLRYLEEAFFVILNEKFAYSPRKRVMNPKKVYLMDTGFAGLGRPFSENRGKILENAVAIELFRQGEEVYYFAGRNECDFIVKRGRRPTQAIQVCWELTVRNEKRELAGLLEARRSLRVDSGMVLTYAQSGRKVLDGWEISILPVWEWLVREGLRRR
jgi:predicted AAA+ superfamily ATPase